MAYKAKVFNPYSAKRKTQVAWLLTESGLYQFLLGCRTARAKEFKEWVLYTVLPSIRKTGRYALGEDAHEELKEINRGLRTQLAEHREELRQTKTTLTAEITQIKAELRLAKAKTHDKMTALRAEAEQRVEDVAAIAAELAASRVNCSAVEEQLKITTDNLETTSGYLATTSGYLTTTQDALATTVAALDQNTNHNVNNVFGVARSSHTPVTKDSSRHSVTHLRGAAFTILHLIAYHLVAGWRDVHRTPIPRTQLEKAVNAIMGTRHAVLSRGAARNYISLYMDLARIAKARFGGTYSTEMPLEHVFLYSRNLNAWARSALHLGNCVQFDLQIEQYFGAAAVANFAFSRMQLAPPSSPQRLITGMLQPT